jgi:hypothetical protein
MFEQLQVRSCFAKKKTLHLGNLSAHALNLPWQIEGNIHGQGRLNLAITALYRILAQCFSIQRKIVTSNCR